MYHYLAVLDVHDFAGYLLGYSLFTTNKGFTFLQPWKLGYYWKLYGVMSLILPAAALVLILHWSRNKWSNHPIARSLQVFVPQGSSWHSVVSSMNVEFRRFDKFSSGAEGNPHFMAIIHFFSMQTSTIVIDSSLVKCRKITREFFKTYDNNMLGWVLCHFIAKSKFFDPEFSMFELRMKVI